MLSFFKSWEYQAYDHGKEIVKSGTVGGMYFAQEYRKLKTPAGLTWNEQMLIASLMEIHLICVGIDDDGEVVVIPK